jgi:hypothetical protein
MGCSMYATAPTLVRTSVFEVRPTATSIELRQALFLRFYGRDFGHEATAKILLALGRNPCPAKPIIRIAGSNPI